MKLIDKSIKQFSEALASASPTPGGGSVAAALGVFGCGLLSMVANVTLAKKSFNGYKERCKKALKESQLIRKKLFELVDQDAKDFESLLKALKRSKNPDKAQPAYKKAAQAPFKVCQNVRRAAMLALELSYVGNQAIISDVAVAIYVLDAAFESARVNVDINLKCIKDRRFTADKMNQCSLFHGDIKRIKSDVLSKVKERMFS